jgi:hypothetical protein
MQKYFGETGLLETLFSREILGWTCEGLHADVTFHCFLIPGSLFSLRYAKTPRPILAIQLITVRFCLGKAVEVSFLYLFLVNCGRGHLYEAGITKR